LEDVGRNKKQRVIWRCLCECGNTVDVSSENLRCGDTQSCGCYKKDRTSETHKKDLTEQKFGKLTVLEDVGRNKHKNVIWKCQCDCGNFIDVSTGHLQSGNTQSCGCYKKELNTERSGLNHPNWMGGITPISKAVRVCTRYEEWRTSIFQRDNFICTHCGTRGGKLVAHHIIRFSKIMRENHITTLEEALQCEALWNVLNGMSLCKKCHKKEHARLRDLDKDIEIDYDTLIEMET